MLHVISYTVRVLGPARRPPRGAAARGLRPPGEFDEHNITYIYIYIYIYIERERERERDVYVCMYVCMYIYIYIS